MQNQVSIFTIPNGGVPIAIPVLRAFHEAQVNFEFHLLPVKKILIPQQTAGFGAITLDGQILLNGPLTARMQMHPDEIRHLARKTMQQIQRRRHAYSIEQQTFQLTERIVLLLDDGLPSGITMLAAIQSLQKYNPLKIVVAVPTASQIAVDRIQPYVHEFICPNIRSTAFFSTEHAYETYSELDIERTKFFLEQARCLARH
jgi:predicted phosphoribosyltransferase